MPGYHYRVQIDWRILQITKKKIGTGHPSRSPNLPILRQFRSYLQQGNYLGSRFCPQRHGPRRP